MLLKALVAGVDGAIGSQFTEYLIKRIDDAGAQSGTTPSNLWVRLITIRSKHRHIWMQPSRMCKILRNVAS